MSNHEDAIEMLEDIAEDMEHGDRAEITVSAILYVVASALKTGQIDVLGTAVMDCARLKMVVAQN